MATMAHHGGRRQFMHTRTKHDTYSCNRTLVAVKEGLFDQFLTFAKRWE